MDLLQQAERTLQHLVTLESRLSDLKQRAEKLVVERHQAELKGEEGCRQMAERWLDGQAQAEARRRQLETVTASLGSRLEALRQAAGQGASECRRLLEAALEPLRGLHRQLGECGQQLEQIGARSQQGIESANQRVEELFERALRPLTEMAEWLAQEFSPLLSEHESALADQGQRLRSLCTETTAQMETDSQRQRLSLASMADDFAHHTDQAGALLRASAETCAGELETQQRRLGDEHSHLNKRLGQKVATWTGEVGEVLGQLQELDSRFVNDARLSNQGVDAVLNLAEDYKKVLE